MAERILDIALTVGIFLLMDKLHVIDVKIAKEVTKQLKEK